MKNICVNPEKYEVFEVINKGYYVVVDKKNKSRLDGLLRIYKRYSNIPDDELVEAYVLKKNKDTERYYFDERDKKNKICINQLVGIWVDLPKPRI